MTKINIKHIHDIIVNTIGKETTISFRDIRGSDVDIVLSETDADFLQNVLNERMKRGAKDDPELA